MALDYQQLVVIRVVAKKSLNVRATSTKSYFSQPVNHNILHDFFAWTFYQFTCLPILEGDIIGITSHYYKKIEEMLISKLYWHVCLLK